MLEVRHETERALGRPRRPEASTSNRLSWRPARAAKRILILLAVVALSIALSPATPALSQRQPPLTPSDAILPPWFQVEASASPPDGEGPWVVRAFFLDRAAVGEDPTGSLRQAGLQRLYGLVARREPWEVHHDEGYVVLDVTQAEYEQMLDAGFQLVIDRQLTARLEEASVRQPSQVSGIPDFPCYRTVEEAFVTAQTIVADHPNLATWTDVGDSWEKHQNPVNGYDLMVLRLTNSAIPGPKPKLFVMTAVHAREYATAELSTRFAEYLVDNHGVDPDATWLLDRFEIHLLLQANPDGRKQAETGVLWRKNTDNDDGCANPTEWGTDLNRNFEFYWHGCDNDVCSSGNACYELYRGPDAASEPETVAIQEYLRAQFPDQRAVPLSATVPVTATGVFLDIHSYGELVLWPWGFETSAPNALALRTLGRKLAYFNGYSPDQASGLYPTDGTTTDFAYGDLGLASYTFELGTWFFEDCAPFESTILPENLAALIYAASTARTPYLTPAGPDALDVVVSTAVVTRGETVHLTATVDDTRYNNSNGTEPAQVITAAEYYVDAPPWIATTTPFSVSMAAVDGLFDAPVEAVEAMIDTGTLTGGKHILLVRGRDAAGNWGPHSATFLTIVEPAVSPVIEGYVLEVGTGLPLTATVIAGPFQATTQPTTGYYSMTVVSGTLVASVGATGYATTTVTDLGVRDHQTVRRDFYLFPLCGVFSDSVEAGNIGWAPEGNWAITSEKAHSAVHSWTDSPGGNYGNRWNHVLVSPILDLSAYHGSSVSFWHTHALQDGSDYGYLEVSTNGGATWKRAAAFTGEGQTAWTQEAMWLPTLDGQPDARLRFSLYTNGWVTSDGWHIDDIALSGGGWACVSTFISPTAEFTGTRAVVLGSPTTFTNLTTGSPPLSYWWDFGDGLGASAENDPTYLYTSTGPFTVTLTVTNGLSGDSDTAAHQFAVDEEIAGLAAANDSPTLLGRATVLTATTTAGTNVSYTWALGDGNEAHGSTVHHRYPATGTYAATVRAANSAGAYTTTTLVTVEGQRYLLPLVLRDT